MSIEDQVTLTPSDEEKFNDETEQALALANGARRHETPSSDTLQNSTIFGDELRSETGTTTVLKPTKLGKRLIGAAVAASLIGGGVSLADANNKQMDNSKTVVGTGSFMPSLETGETWGEADAAVNEILEEGGIDPNKISYQEVGNALSPALDQEREVTEGPLSPGASFDTTVYEQTDLFGGKHYTVDIDSSKYIAQQDTNKDK